MNEKFYPVGTVVILGNAKKKMMITGYCHKTANNSIYDYCGVLFPEGYTGAKENMLFNHNQITEICFKGFEDEEHKIFNKDLHTLSSNSK